MCACVNTVKSSYSDIAYNLITFAHNCSLTSFLNCPQYSGICSIKQSLLLAQINSVTPNQPRIKQIVNYCDLILTVDSSIIAMFWNNRKHCPAGRFGREKNPRHMP